MNNILRLQQFEVEYGSGAGASRGHLMLGLEQKSFRWFMDLGAKFSNPRGVMMESCVWTLAVAKARLLLSEHWRFGDAK